MPFCRALVELATDTLIPSDVITNTWHFETPGAVADAGTAITDNLDAFYTAIQAHLSSVLTGAGTVLLYDLEDPSPRPPVFTGAISFTPDTAAYPNEVAVALSYQAPVVAGEAQARRRGRIFIGPMSQDAGTSSTGGPRPSSSCRTDICAAADALKDDTTLAGLVWSVFSPTTAGAPPWSSGDLATAFHAVTNGWVDDAFDTIRSRGVAATNRTLFT